MTSANADPVPEIPGSVKSNTLLGIVLMALAMLVIPLVDGLAKHLSAAHSPLFISWARYVAATLIIVPVSLIRHRARFLPRTQLGAHFLRTVFLMAAMTLYFVAVSLIPMATANSAFFIGPIFAMLLAVFYLGERLSGRKILAVILGFGGSLFILQPGGEIEYGTLLAMASGIFFAFYLVATRQASRVTDPVRTLAFQCLVGMAILFPFALWNWSVPAVEQLYLFAGMGLFSTISHLLSITALRYAEATTLAPLVYVELIGTTAVGLVFFAELPGLHVWIGASVIVAGGLLLIRRTQRL